MPIVEGTSLCVRCRSLQIPSLLRGPRYETEDDLVYSEELDVQVASISELREQSNCHLCRLLVRIYDYELKGHFTDDDGEAGYYASRKDPRKICCKLRPTRADLILKYDPCGMAEMIATQLLVEFDPAVPAGFHIWNQDQADAKRNVSNPGFRFNNLSLYRGWSIALDHGSAVPGRPLLNRSSQKDERIQISQMQSLLDTCRSYHPYCNRKVESTAEGAKTTPMMLLDVSKRMMVLGNSDFRYIALSYVWDYVDRESYPGFKDGFPEGCTVPELPSIMEDSIAIVRQLKEKYLWIDLLCIDQQNPAIKRMQIKQMHIVYSHAEFTVVVLARSNVHEGIPGIRPNSRKVEHYRIDVDCQVLAVGTVWHHFYTMAGSTWNSRGWTLEEGMLSRRCLVFGPNEMFFDCGSGIGSETLGLPVYHPTSQTTVSLQHGRGMRDYKFWNKAFPAGWDFSFYAQNVTYYSERDLSHTRDSLNAFLGVLSRLTFITNMRFVQGLPRDDLLKGLLWFPIHRTSSRLTGFPSWTWAGWTGPRLYCEGYLESIDQTQEQSQLSTGPGSNSRLANVRILDDSKDHSHIEVSSHVRQFSLRSLSNREPLYALEGSDGKMMTLLGPTAGYNPGRGFTGYDDEIFLTTHPDSISDPIYFLYLVHLKDVSKNFDHILAMYIRKVDDDLFERMALCGIPAQEWNVAPVTENVNYVLLA